MKERPILFSAPMIRAILDGRKTQTRRVVKPQPAPHEEIRRAVDAPGRADSDFFLVKNDAYNAWSPIREPYGKPGDRLWVRETWYCDDFTERDFEAARVGRVTPVSDAEIISEWRESLYYRADTASGRGSCCELIPECMCAEYKTKSGRTRSPWKPGIHMPRWASRISLEVTGVRIERLRAIKPTDVIAEGISHEDARCDGECGATPCSMLVPAFERLWSEINGAESWGANPWVWVVSFKRLEAQERAA